MPAASRYGDLSAGHACFPPTACVDPGTNKTYINGILAQTLGSEFVQHRCRKVVHPQSQRATNSGSSKVTIEGHAAIRIGDSIICGDTVGQGSRNVQIGG